MISERIKELREKNNFTQTTLAKRLGISRSAVNAWEMGISVPSTQFVVMLANIFNTTCDYILGADTSEYINISGLSKNEKKIIYSILDEFKSTKALINEIKENGFELSE